MTQFQMLNELKDQLTKNKYLQLDTTQFPLDNAEWSLLNHLTDPPQMNYVKTTLGDGGESHDFMISGVLSEGDLTPIRPDIFSLVFADKVRAFLRFITQIDDLTTTRCQVHILQEGSFIGRHIDSNYTKDYLFAVLFVLSDQYENGKFILELPTSEVLALKPKKNTVLLLDCDLPHAVEKVTKGDRKTLVYFLRRPANSD